VAAAEAAFTPEEEAAVRKGREPRTASVAAIQALLPPRACLLEYQLVGRDLVGFAITRGGMQAHVARLGYRLEGVANRFLRACAGGADAAQEAQTLARALLEPFAAVLEASERVIVVPSGALNAVPFQLLPFGGEPLGATRVVSLLPAAALLARCGVDRPLAAGPTLVIGDPAFDAAAHPGLRRLAGAAVEARAVAERYASDAVFMDADAQEAALRPALPGRALVHVAAHGRLDEIAPNTSSIVLAGADELTVSDLIGLHIGADLAVLSACDTGRGTTTLGGDLVGLARGLTAAGVLRCVVSLWPVDDVAACVTMAAFHARVQAGVPPARALAEAQREIRALSGEEIAARYRALGGTLAPGSRAVRRKAHGGTRALEAFPELDDADTDTPVEAQGGHLSSIWAPFVLIGA
jgi:CHAT domain-containing protein